MARTYCKPKCRCCGKYINVDFEDYLKVPDGVIHLECEEEYYASTMEVDFNL